MIREREIKPGGYGRELGAREYGNQNIIEYTDHHQSAPSNADQYVQWAPSSWTSLSSSVAQKTTSSRRLGTPTLTHVPRQAGSTQKQIRCRKSHAKENGQNAPEVPSATPLPIVLLANRRPSFAYPAPRGSACIAAPTASALLCVIARHFA